MLIEADETELKGNWIEKDEQVIEDETCKRINYLIDEVLTYLSTDSSGWEKLFKDPADGRLWELTHPNSDWHGGGPKVLVLISAQDAKSKYNIQTNS